jgi:hypothetical protein
MGCCQSKTIFQEPLIAEEVSYEEIARIPNAFQFINIIPPRREKAVSIP